MLVVYQKINSIGQKEVNKKIPFEEAISTVLYTHAFNSDQWGKFFQSFLHACYWSRSKVYGLIRDGSLQGNCIFLRHENQFLIQSHQQLEFTRWFVHGKYLKLMSCQTPFIHGFVGGSGGEIESQIFEGWYLYSVIS